MLLLVTLTLFTCFEWGYSQLCDINGASCTYTETIVADNTAHNGFHRLIQASGCPNHYNACQKPLQCDLSNPTTQAMVTNKDFTIPAYPCIATTTTNVSCSGGPIGITLNGVIIYSQFGGTPCVDAVQEEGSTFDYCGGHADPNGAYHYHVSPSCLLHQLNDYVTPSPNGHSPQIGWAFDGFPVYGPHGNNGDYIYSCTHPSANASDCLDSCGGHDQHEEDGFTYHYHIVGPVGDLSTNPLNPLPSTDMHPYTFGCLKGAVSINRLLQSSCSATNGYNSDYTASATPGVCEQHCVQNCNVLTANPTSDPTNTPQPTRRPKSKQ